MTSGEWQVGSDKLGVTSWEGQVESDNMRGTSWEGQVESHRCDILGGKSQ